MPISTDCSSLAKRIFNSSLRVKSGDRVWVHSWDHTLDPAEAFALECEEHYGEVRAV